MPISPTIPMVISQSADGTKMFFPPDLDKIIIGTDFRKWLTASVFEASSATHDKTCPICLEIIVPGDQLSHFSCGHDIHFECIHYWICQCMKNCRPALCPLYNLVILCPVLDCSVRSNESSGRVEIIQNIPVSRREVFWRKFRSFMKKMSLCWMKVHS